MRVRIEAEIEVPDGTPMDQVEEWLRFHMGARADMAATNPLANTDLPTVGCSYVYATEA